MPLICYTTSASNKSQSSRVPTTWLKEKWTWPLTCMALTVWEVSKFQDPRSQPSPRKVSSLFTRLSCHSLVKSPGPTLARWLTCVWFSENSLIFWLNSSESWSWADPQEEVTELPQPNSTFTSTHTLLTRSWDSRVTFLWSWCLWTLLTRSYARTTYSTSFTAANRFPWPMPYTTCSVATSKCTNARMATWTTLSFTTLLSSTTFCTLKNTSRKTYCFYLNS